MQRLLDEHQAERRAMRISGMRSTRPLRCSERVTAEAPSYAFGSRASIRDLQGWVRAAEDTLEQANASTLARKSTTVAAIEAPAA